MTTGNNTGANISVLVQTHYRWGWPMLFVFLTLGFFLETLHGFKIGFYLDASNETRRLMWTLSHAHGTLLSVLNLVFATFLNSRSDWPSASRVKLASRLLIGGSVLLPVSFFFSGVFTYDGDPGLFIYLAPVGALLLMAAVFLIARLALATSAREADRD